MDGMARCIEVVACWAVGRGHEAHLRTNRRAEKRFNRPKPTNLFQPPAFVHGSVDWLMIARIFSSLNLGTSEMIKAAAAATWGAAAEVPLKVSVKSPRE